MPGKGKHDNTTAANAPTLTWWSEAPEWPDDLNEVADVLPAIGAVRPLSAPSRRSIAGPRLGALFGLTVLLAG